MLSYRLFIPILILGMIFSFKFGRDSRSVGEGREVVLPSESRVEYIDRVVYDTIYLTSIPPKSVVVDTLIHYIDSVIYHPMATYTFGEDERWQAVVRGREVSLEKFWMVEPTLQKTTIITKPPHWELQALLAIAPQSSWVGLSTTHHFGNQVLTLGAGYDLWNTNPHFEARLGVVIFRK